MITVSCIGTAVFILQEMIFDRESHIRDSLLVMSMSKSAYNTSYFIGQGIFTAANALILCFGFLLANGNTYGTNGKSSTFFFGVLLFAFSQISMSMAVSTLFKTRMEAFTASLWLLLLPFGLTVLAISKMLTQAAQGQTPSPAF